MSNLIREQFELIKKASGGYDVECLECNLVSKAWDFRNNALAVGYSHVVNAHLPGFANAADFSAR